MVEAEQGQTHGWLAAAEVIAGGVVAVVEGVGAVVEIDVPFTFFFFPLSFFQV